MKISLREGMKELENGFYSTFTFVAGWNGWKHPTGFYGVRAFVRALP